jgi:hypothetical protein
MRGCGIRWLLCGPGDGVRLAQAGFLPPAVVIEPLTARCGHLMD